jgi:hypothetical protein
MLQKMNTTLSVRIATETLHLLQKEAGRIRVPVGTYIRNIIENHVCAQLPDVRNDDENNVTIDDSASAVLSGGKSVDDGRPTYRLIRQNGRWSIDPFQCWVKLRRKNDDNGNQAVELEVFIANTRENLCDEWGNLVARDGITINSSRCGRESVPPATTYEEAVMAVNARKPKAEEVLRCHLDFSALTDAEKSFP